MKKWKVKNIIVVEDYGVDKMDYRKVQLPVFSQNKEIAVCLGNFDGIHKGHQKLIKKTVEVAKKDNITSAFFTFSPNPRKFFSKDRVYQLTSIEDRKELVKQYNIDLFLEFEFNQLTMNLSPTEFIEQVLIPLNVKYVICGFDYTFGKFGAGKVQDLIDLGKNKYEVIVIDELEYNDSKVSTTRIMDELSKGNIELVSNLLGREYSIEGKIIKGLKNGKKLGFPTINIDNGEYFLPKTGVYGLEVVVNGQKVRGIGNIGTHPTISELEKPILEIHLLDFSDEIYGEIAKITFKKFLREERKFNNVDDLKKQIKIDTFSNF